MTEHRLQVADVFRTYGDHFLALWDRVLSRPQRKAFDDIRNCRTAALVAMCSITIAGIAPSLTIRVATEVARSARVRRRAGDWPIARGQIESAEVIEPRPALFTNSRS